MKCIVRMDELDDFSEYMKKYIKDNLDTNIKHLIEIFDNVEWVGGSKKLYLEILEQKVNLMQNNIKTLYFYAFFYKYASKHFSEANQLVNIKWNEVYNEFFNMLENLGDK